MKHKAIALILSCSVIVVLVILGQVTLSRSIAEQRVTDNYVESSRSFWAAEAGLAAALLELRDDFDWESDPAENIVFGEAVYNVTVDDVVIGQSKKITVSATTGLGVTRQVAAVITKAIPVNFFGNALYSAADLDIQGNAFSVVGDVIYADEFGVDHPGNIDGVSAQDPSISPLARFNFEELLAISQAQGNVYDVNPNNNELLDPDTGNEKALPTSFWHYTPDANNADAQDANGNGAIEPNEDGVDNDGDGVIDNDEENMPNVVYINGSLTLNRQDGQVAACGFLIVVGDVITDPDNTEDATINGTGWVDGVIYTLGEFDVNGGGAAGLNVDGGVWAGEGITLNGSVNVAYNEVYMSAIGNMDIQPVPQITSWIDPQNPYALSQ